MLEKMCDFIQKHEDKKFYELCLVSSVLVAWVAIIYVGISEVASIVSNTHVGLLEALFFIQIDLYSFKISGLELLPNNTWRTVSDNTFLDSFQFWYNAIYIAIWIASLRLLSDKRLIAIILKVDLSEVKEQCIKVYSKLVSTFKKVLNSLNELDSSLNKLEKSPQKNYVIIGVIVAVFLLLIIGRDGTSNNRLSNQSAEKLCRSYISKLFSRSIWIIKTSHIKYDGGHFVKAYYNRTSDGKYFEYVCSIHNGDIIWAGVFNRNEIGRWRYEDEMNYKKNEDGSWVLY